MRNARIPLLLALLLGAAPALASTPAAPPPPGGSATVLALFGYGDALGIGGRYRLSVAPNGLLTSPGSVRDSLDVEFGLDLISWYNYGDEPYSYGYTMLAPRAGLMWDLWLSPQVAVYPKLDLGIGFGSYTGDPPPSGKHDFTGLFLEPAVGCIWRFQPNLSLRGELGTQGLRIGLGFDF